MVAGVLVVPGMRSGGGKLVLAGRQRLFGGVVLVAGMFGCRRVGMILVPVVLVIVFHKQCFMIRIILYVVLALVLFVLLYDIYQTKSYKSPKQVVLAVAGVILLLTILYTCQSDN